MAFLVFLPGMLLAYFPMKQHLRLRPAKLAAATVSLILSLILAGESVRFLFHVDILWLFFPASEMPPSGLAGKPRRRFHYARTLSGL